MEKAQSFETRSKRLAFHPAPAGRASTPPPLTSAKAPSAFLTSWISQSRRSKQCDNLPGIHGNVGRRDYLYPGAVRLRIELLKLARFNDWFDRRCSRGAHKRPYYRSKINLGHRNREVRLSELSPVTIL